MQKRRVFSLIVPCYNEGENIETYYEQTSGVIGKLLSAGTISDYEFLFVNDGSKDDTLGKIRALSQTDKHLHYISFTRNFGKEAAMLAGLENCVGDVIAIMDADLQDPPELMLEMFSKMDAESDCECVAARRVSRKGEPVVRSFFARVFYHLINRISNVEIAEGARDYRLMSRRMLDSILTLKEKSRFSKGLFVWPGYKTCYVAYENVERTAGKSKWSFWKLFRYAMDGITSFSVAPLQLSSAIGLLFFTVAFLAVVFFVIQKLFFGISVQGYALLICSIFLLGGLQLLCIGVLGQYLAKVFIEDKRRPDYVVLECLLDQEVVSKGEKAENTDHED